jgi:retron-type reverse transcriptase
MINHYKFNKKERHYLKTGLFAAYYECRRNKRNTHNALRFELNQEKEILSLYEEILSGTYQVGYSRAFIVFEPVQREIFAANFRDRVVHHYIISRLEPVFERLFIYDSYSCRSGKGTHFGVSRINRFIRSCSQNYTKDCYVLKVDIHGFFMNIRREILLEKVLAIIEKYYTNFDRQLLIDLCRKVILYNPVPDCIIKGRREDWNGLPANKSLFNTGGKVGIPIGNLTSQIFANLYLNDFDHFVKRDLKQRYYGRYVDDCILVNSSKEELTKLVGHLSAFLQEKLALQLHPKKIYLQHYTKGILFAGIFIKPYCQYAGKRIKRKINAVMLNKYRSNFSFDDKRTDLNLSRWICSVNSYLGICKHYNTYRFRKNLIKRFEKDPVVRFDKKMCVVKKGERAKARKGEGAKARKHESTKARKGEGAKGVKVII